MNKAHVSQEIKIITKWILDVSAETNNQGKNTWNVLALCNDEQMALTKSE